MRSLRCRSCQLVLPGVVAPSETQSIVLDCPHCDGPSIFEAVPGHVLVATHHARPRPRPRPELSLP